MLRNVQDMKFGWKIAVGTIIGFLGAAFGSVGGVGGGGIFVPMLTLIIGFDQKSSTALSKCRYSHRSLVFIAFAFTASLISSICSMKNPPGPLIRNCLHKLSDNCLC